MKKKIVVLVKIAVVLCSVFLVAIPAIAAEQNQTMQKVSANTITTASEDDYVLGIYGNANEDDTIDMRDLTYVKLIFFGKKPETELADAKYDGKINPLDFIQIKLIIVGKEKELTFVDAYGDVVTVNKPVERIVVLYGDHAEVLRALDAADKIVGITTYISDGGDYFPKLGKLPSVGSWMRPDYEAILNLNPDLLMVVGGPKHKGKLPGITVICLRLSQPPFFTEGVRKLGYILNKKEEAEEYINWHERCLNAIKEQTEGLSDDEKPRVLQWIFYKPGASEYRCITKTANNYEMGVIAGGENIAKDIIGTWPTVDPEWVIEQNPDIIVAYAYYTYIPSGYMVDNPSAMAAARVDILNRPELANVNAVKNGNVYMLDHGNFAWGGSGCLIGTVYLAKWFQPELFEDLDPEAIHQEYLTRFQGLDYDLDEHGVFVYPPIEINGGLAGIPDRYKGQI